MSNVQSALPQPVMKPDDKRAKFLIWTLSGVIFLVIVSLTRIKIDWHPGFDPHVFAFINAVVNSAVAISLIAALLAIKSQSYRLHKNLMLLAIGLSVVFLMSYVAHHILTGDTKFGDINRDNVVSAEEKAAVGNFRYFYYALLLTHIPLAAIILPFILFTSYRALSGQYHAHKKLARYTWPIWLYVAVSGVVIYVMISPYYGS